MCRFFFAAIFAPTMVPGSARADDPPIPQDAAVREKHKQEKIAWIRSLGEAYEKVGKRDPRWDAEARQALTLTPIPDADPSEIYKHARLAVEAGCDDAQILYIYATNSWTDKQIDDAEVKKRMARAVAAFEKSSYSPVRRGVILMKFALSMMNDKITPEGRKEADRLLELALSLISKSVKEDGRGFEAAGTRNDLAWDIITGQKWLLKDSEAAFRKVDAALAKSPDLRVLRLQIEGQFYTDYAWEARGMGLAPTVKEDVWRLFGGRLTRAKRALDRAWQLDPSGVKTPNLMLPVLRGLGCERPEMETWFRRAMEADPDNYLACYQKMVWLDPKWHGSPEEVLAFGKACKATKNWWSKITLLGPDCHYFYVETGPKEDREKYLARADVWEDIRSTFEEYLGHRPDDAGARSSYAALAYLCGKYDESAKQFEIVGDKLTATNFCLWDNMKEIRDYVVGRAKAKASRKKAR